MGNLQEGYAWKNLQLPEITEAESCEINSIHAGRRQELVFIGIDMQVDTICKALDEALLTDEEFAMGPESWSGWKKLVPKKKHDGHSHHHHHHGEDNCLASDEYVNHVNDIIRYFFPEIADPSILENPESSIAKLSEK